MRGLLTANPSSMHTYPHSVLCDAFNVALFGCLVSDVHILGQQHVTPYGVHSRPDGLVKLDVGYDWVQFSSFGAPLNATAFVEVIDLALVDNLRAEIVEREERQSSELAPVQ